MKCERLLGGRNRGDLYGHAGHWALDDCRRAGKRIQFLLDFGVGLQHIYLVANDERVGRSHTDAFAGTFLRAGPGHHVMRTAHLIADDAF